MIYLPGSCERCRYMALISSQDCVNGRALCAACGGLVNILPGPAYPEGDVPLFDELLTCVEATGIAGLEAEQLGLAIEDARSGFDEQNALHAISTRIPALAPLSPLLAASNGRTRQALSMLEVILHALAKERRSGAMLRGLQSTAGQTSSVAKETWQEDEPLPPALGDTNR